MQHDEFTDIPLTPLDELVAVELAVYPRVEITGTTPALDWPPPPLGIATVGADTEEQARMIVEDLTALLVAYHAACRYVAEHNGRTVTDEEFNRTRPRIVPCNPPTSTNNDAQE